MKIGVVATVEVWQEDDALAPIEKAMSAIGTKQTSAGRAMSSYIGFTLHTRPPLASHHPQARSASSQ
jgi:hypothetical protein